MKRDSILFLGIGVLFTLIDLSFPKRILDTVIGIHFGRKYARFSNYKSYSLDLIPNSVGDLKTPIIVSFDKDGKIFVGREALFSSDEYIVLDNLQDIAGKTFDEIAVMKDFPFKYEIKNKYNKPYIIIKGRNITLELTIEDALSHVFRYVKQCSERYFNSNITYAALSVPDHYSESQVLSIKAAANFGGLRITRDVKDSVSLIYAYELNEVEEEKSIFTIDMSENSTSLTIISCEKNGHEVIGFHHYSMFGERNFLQKLEDYISDLYDRITGTKLSKVGVIKELKREVSRVAYHLTTFPSFEFSWTSIGVDLTETFEITRSKFDQLIMETIGELLHQITHVLMESELKRSDISQIIVFGSFFNVVKIRKEIENYFYGHGLRFENGLSEAVALGIAKIGRLQRDSNTIYYKILPDVVFFDIGIEVFGGVFYVIVPHLSVIPVKKSKFFTVTFDDQNTINIVVSEGTQKLSKKNTFLGQMVFKRSPAKTRGNILFEVEIQIDSPEELLVLVKDLEKDVIRSLKIKRSFEEISERERSGRMDDMKSERDKEHETYYEIRQDIESIAYEIRAHIENKSSMISKINSIFDLKILKESVTEVISFFEKYSFTEFHLLQELKSKFDSNVKPILEKIYSS